MKAGSFLVNLLCVASLVGCVHKRQVSTNPNLVRAQETLDSIYQCYSQPGINLLRENYPFNGQSNVTYLASDEQANQVKSFHPVIPYILSYRLLHTSHLPQKTCRSKAKDKNIRNYWMKGFYLVWRSISI